jgi:hypothetical protein
MKGGGITKKTTRANSAQAVVKFPKTNYLIHQIIIVF